MSDWTKSREQLPYGEYVSCFVSSKNMFGRYLTFYATYYNGSFYKRINEDFRTVEIPVVVDYWMTIPEVDDE